VILYVSYLHKSATTKRHNIPTNQSTSHSSIHPAIHPSGLKP
jgi:hypothetical protein